MKEKKPKFFIEVWANSYDTIQSKNCIPIFRLNNHLFWTKKIKCKTVAIFFIYPKN